MEKNKNSILIIDDENLNILALKQILGNEYTIHALKNGCQALETAEKFLPDVILLDILMPNINGYEVITQLKNSPKTKDIPVIFVSGLVSVEDEEKGLALGAADYITKPFTPAIVKLRLQNQIKMLEQLRTIEQLNEEAQVASRSKSTFLAMMSHEIRTPMNAILGITEILSENESLPDEAAEGLAKIYSSGNLLLAIINDILDFTKIDAGKLDIIPGPYNIASLISDSIHLNMMKIGTKPIKFELYIDENIPANLVGDELRIKQILNNLLSNAFKYTDAGKVTLTVSFEIKNETVSGCADNDETKVAVIIFKVQDTGHGMEPEQLEKLFTEYSRFNKGKNRRAIEGTGLGLVITQRIIQLMGGSIAVESEPEKGSVFTIRLPQEIADNKVLGKEQAEMLKRVNVDKATDGLSGAVSLKKRAYLNREPMPYGSVLVVDDIETNIDVVIGLLKPYGLKVDAVMSGSEAIEIIKSGKKYDVILMDHLMPDIDGIEATRLIREWEKEQVKGKREQGTGVDVSNHSELSTSIANEQQNLLPDTCYLLPELSPLPIIALTANAIAGQADIFLRNGFDDYISKPIDIRQLDAVLNKFIRDKQPPEVLEAARLNSGKKNNGQADTVLIYDSFVRDAKKCLSLFDELLRDGSIETEDGLRKFTIMVHGIKSSLGNIGETALRDTASKLEKCAHNKEIEYIKSHLPEFTKDLKALLETLEKKANDAGEANPADTEDTEELCQTLLQIKDMLADFDRKGVLDILTGIKNCTKETRKILDSIKEKIMHSEFDEAEKDIEAYLDVLCADNI